MPYDQYSSLHPDRLFPSDNEVRTLARHLYEQVKDLPIMSPHGHTDPAWFAENKAFSNAAELLLVPDHYVLRMLYSQGVDLAEMGVRPKDGSSYNTDARSIWRLFASHYHLFRGTPSRMWLDHVFHDIFGLSGALTEASADLYFDKINEKLASDDFKPRALMDRFNIELIATTEGAVDTLPYHAAIRGTPWAKRVITTFRPDDVVDPERADFQDNILKLADLTGADTASWDGYLKALKIRRAYFRTMGATATDHGHPTAATANLSAEECVHLFAKCLAGTMTAAEAELFRAQMLTEMAKMSLEDGMTMQIHAGTHRNHNPFVFNCYGRDKGADIPTKTDFVNGLKPMLDLVGNEKGLTIILFTMDETTYARELAPLAGHYPCLRLGPPWWFHDSPEGMMRFRRQVTETAGFYNTVGFNDDTRAFLSIPARHDVARRMDCRFLAELVSEHRLSVRDAEELAYDLTYGLVKKAYRLDAGRGEE